MSVEPSTNDNGYMSVTYDVNASLPVTNLNTNEQLFEKLWTDLSNFVRITCLNRDETHGYNHMCQVATLGMRICNNFYPLNYDSDNKSSNNDLGDGTNNANGNEIDFITKCLVCIVAWLHDVNDSKYACDDNKVAIDKFLSYIYGKYEVVTEGYNNEHNFVTDLNLAIDYVSYSKEVKLFGKLEVARWEQVLPSQRLILVRNIVSDADKIESLGSGGVERCIGYSRHKHPGRDDKQHIKHLVDHYDEKLGHLYDKYIVTSAGKLLAKQPHDIMLDIVSQYRSQV